MNGLITIVGEDFDEWEDVTCDSNRFSIFTQNLMLAEKVSKRQHLSPRTSKFKEDDERSSFYSAGPDRHSLIVRADSPTIPEEDIPVRTPTPVLTHPTPTITSTTPANIGRPRTSGRRTRQISNSSSGDWTWRPSIPQRVSSMGTKRGRSIIPGRPELVAFHRRSCQLFSSLDSTLSNATSNSAYDAGSPNGSHTSTSPSLASSVSTQATSVLDEDWHVTPAFPSFHVELHDPSRTLHQNLPESPDFGDFLPSVNHTPRIGIRRSSSQLSPQITSTRPLFWTSETTRQAEYAKIDAAHGGLKGFVKRMLPRSWSWVHGKRRNFHPSSPVLVSQKSPRNDDDSVRRFRVSIASATQEAIRGVEEHGVSGMNTPLRCASPFVDEDPVSVNIDAQIQRLNDSHKLKSAKTGPVNKVLAKVRSSDALAKMFRSHSQKIDKTERRSKTLSREYSN